MASAFWQSAEQSRVRLFETMCEILAPFYSTAILTSSLDNCWSLSRSICLNTLTAAGPSLVSNNSISWCRVASPGRRGTINLLFSPPYSHPSLIWPTPIWNSNGSFLQIIAFLSKEDSNLVPSSKVLVKCIVTCWPNLALFSQVSGRERRSNSSGFRHIQIFHYQTRWFHFCFGQNKANSQTKQKWQGIHFFGKKNKK